LTILFALLWGDEQMGWICSIDKALQYLRGRLKGKTIEEKIEKDHTE